MKNLILIVGNVIDCIQLIGPFEDQDDIDDYVETNRITEEWVATELISPPRKNSFFPTNLICSNTILWKSGHDLPN